MRGVTVELPPLALSKLQELELARAAAEDAGRAAANRLAALPINADASLRERWSVERDKQNRKHADLARLGNSVRQWLFQQRQPLALVQPVDIELKVPLPAAVESAREEIKAVQQRLAAVRGAPPRRSDKQKAINQYLDRLAQQARPKIVFDVRGNASVRWADDVITGKDDVLSLLAFALGPQLSAAFRHVLDAEPERADALAPAEKAKRTAELEAQLLQAEQFEEMLIERAASEGITIDRRPDVVNVCVVLGVVVAKAQASQVA
jgi:hypothetical protein